MENVKNIYLNDIKRNIYFLENYKIQIMINGRYINIYDDDLILDGHDFITKPFILLNDKLNCLINEKVDAKIDFDSLGGWLEYNTYNHNFYGGHMNEILNTNLTNYLINTITYYILKFRIDLIDEYIDILKKNILCTKLKKIIMENGKELFSFDKMIFNKNLFEDIYNLKLNIKFVFCNKNTFNLIIDSNVMLFDNKKMIYSLYYWLGGKGCLQLRYYKNTKNEKIYKYYYLLDDKFNVIETYNLIYDEILIVDCINNKSSIINKSIITAENKSIEDKKENDDDKVVEIVEDTEKEELKKEIEELKKKISEQTKSEVKLKKEFTELQEKNKILVLMNEDLNKQLSSKEKIEEKKEDIDESKDEKDFDELKEKFETLTNKYKFLLKIVNGYADKLDCSVKENEQLSSLIDELDKENEQAFRDYEPLYTENKELRKKIEQLQKDIQHLDAINKYQFERLQASNTESSK